jgi:hypothetical protein
MLSNGTAFARPAPLSDPEPGMRWEAVRADPAEWSAVPPPEPGEAPKGCRFRGKAPRACGQPAALRMMRGIRSRIPWFYCAADAYREYGVWAEDAGAEVLVMRWQQVPE